MPHQAASEPFVDPAILSFIKPLVDIRKVSGNSPQSRHPSPGTNHPVMIADGIKQGPVSGFHDENNFPSTRTAPSSAATLLPATKSQTLLDGKDSTVMATLTKPFDHMTINDGKSDMDATVAEGNSSVRGNGKKNGRGATRKAKDAVSKTSLGMADIGTGNGPQKVVKTSPGKSKGWRQTPLVEEAPITKSHRRPKRSNHQSRKALLEDNSGWATEDATDIQDLGEFDFEHNLSKFDKSRVFNDIRKDDTIAAGDRLVSLNRKTRPGTNGGRHLHSTENVLDVPGSKADTWKREVGDTEGNEQLEEQYSSGRASRRAVSWRPPASASLRLTSTNKPCTCVFPLQMVEIEQLCTSELGLTDEMLSENAGRGVAEAALTLPPDLCPNPNILFLVGNHKSGSRAVAGARHLRNRNVRVSICILGGERENMLLESLRRQLEIYRKSGGWTVRWDEFQSKHSSDAPHDLVVDALLGMHVTFSELRTDDQAIAFEMIRWANRSTIPVLSVDVPSGLDASSGEVTHVGDSSPLIIHAAFVACLGAPKTGLLAALGTGEARSHDWALAVVDIGISNVAWRKYGTRRRHGVDFGKAWVVNVKFVGGGGGGE